MITVKDLCVSKNGRAICSVPELSVSAAERVAILGTNGSGKSTLLRVLAGLEKNYQGHCQLDATRKDRVYVHQAPYLFRGSMLSNVVYGLRQRGINRTRGNTLAKEWLERFGLREVSRKSVSGLSGGEIRRVALARAMVLRPRLLLLDEPLGDMDEAGATALQIALNELPETTVLIASPTPLPENLVSTIYELKAAAD